MTKRQTVNTKIILWLTLFGGLVSVLGLALTLEASGQAVQVSEGSAHLATEAELFPNCRLGVAAFNGQLQAYDIVSNLGTGWYINFSTELVPPSPAGAEFVQMIRTYQGPEARGGTNTCGPSYPFTITPALTDTVLGARVDANPGALWIVGNEPDRVSVQDDICPQQYAEAYHDTYHFIKGRDPAAQVAIAGLVQVSPGRLQYLDIVWNTYLAKYGTPMPVDVWTVHIYILSETGEGDAHVALGTNPALAIPHGWYCPDPNSICQAEHDDLSHFANQVRQMRQWMKDHGQQNKPLIMTEYGILKPYNYYGMCPPGTTMCPSNGSGIPGCFCDEYNETFHPQRVADYVSATFSYMMTVTDTQLGYPADEYRLMQQWLWYSLKTEGPQDLAHASNLVTDTYDFTIPGQQWHNYAADISPTVNLLPAQVPWVVGHAENMTDPVTVTLSATIVNNGNTALTDVVTVTFYSNAAMTETIGSATFTGLGGCARRQVVVTTTWESLDTGAHTFWVKVDSAEAVTETWETDNTASGVALVNPHQRFLPLVLSEE
jgi:hypothetical protein